MRTRQRLPAGYSLLSVRKPITLLEPECAALRVTLVMVSDEVAGEPTAALWESTFTTQFLGALTRFFVLCDSEENVVGWSGYRACTIGRDRVVFFTSTGLLHRSQDLGLLSAVQHRTVRSEARHHPFSRIVPAVCTHHPPEGPVAEADQSLVTALGVWLDLDVDPATAVIRGGNEEAGSRLAFDRRRALGLVFSSARSAGVFDPPS